MKVSEITLTNVRSIMTAELRFQPGFNLVVGENGVGKTTLIDALAICLFEFERVYNRSDRGAPRRFSDDDIRVEAEALDLECSPRFRTIVVPLCDAPGSWAERRKTGDERVSRRAAVRRPKHSRRNRSGGVTRAPLGGYVLDE